MGAVARLSPKTREWILASMHWVVIILSVLLIVFISVDTFEHVNFMDSRPYMTFQLWVCLVFIADFFIELALSPSRGHYARTHWCYLLLSIPYINILSLLDVHLGGDALYFIRFIPLARGALAMSIVVGYVAGSKVGGMLWSYISILLLLTYFISLIFLQFEGAVNPSVRNYWDSLWWSFLEMTTVGAPIAPVTVVGKLCAAALSTLGVIMFPLFTVYLTTWVRSHWLDSLRTNS